MELLRKDSYSEEEVREAAEQYCRLQPYLGLLKHVLKTHAKEIGKEQPDFQGYSIGGEEINSRQSGALHVYCQRSKIPLAPVRSVLAEYFFYERWKELEAQGYGEQALKELEHLLGRWRTPWMMTALQKRDDWDAIQRYLDEHGGYGMEYGKAELKVRTRPPNAGFELLAVSHDGEKGSLDNDEEQESDE